jgi:hypothetical protein
MIVGEFASRLPQHSDIRIIEVPTGTDPIEKKPDFNSTPGAFAKGISELMANFVRVQDIGRKVDSVLRGANLIQHRRKIFVSVDEQINLVAFNRHWVAKRKSGSEKLRIAHGECMLEVILERLTANKEEAEDKHDSQETKEKSDPISQGEFPPTLVQPMGRTRAFSGHA